MTRILVSLLAIALAGVIPVAAQAEHASVPVRFENRGLPVDVKLFEDGVQCDLSPRGRGILTIGVRKGSPMRNQFDETLVAGQPVDIVLVREAFRPARVGVASADAIGVRTRLVPQAGLEYRVRVAHQSTRLDAIIESRPRGSRGDYDRVPVEVSYAARDLCVKGARAG